MFFKLLWNSLTRRRSRKLLALACVWIGLSLVVALLVLSLDVGDKMNRELCSFGSNINVEPVAASLPVKIGGYDVAPTTSTTYLAEASFMKLKSIFWRNNLLAFSPSLWTTGRVGNTAAPLEGVWFNQTVPVEGGGKFITGARQTHLDWQLSGSWPSGKADKPVEALVGVDLARKLGLHAGDTTEVATSRGRIALVVSGVLTTGQREDGALVAPLHTVQRLAGLPDRVSEGDISALTTPDNELTVKYQKDPKSLTPAEYDRWFCTPYPGSVAAQIQKAIPGSVARVVRRVAETQGAVLIRVEGLMSLLAALTLIVCCFSVTGVLTSAVLERRPEVALMQALGAQRDNVLLLFLSEAAILGVGGGLLASVSGSLLGAWLVRIIFDSKAVVHVAAALLSPILGLLVAWFGSFTPVWKALRHPVAETLRGN